MAAPGPVNVCRPQHLADDDLYLVTNETGQKEIQEQFAKVASVQALPGKKAASGVSGFFILNLASLDPKIERIDLYDVSERVTTFWKAFNEIIKEEGDRHKAVSKVIALIQARRGEFFSKDLEENLKSTIGMLLKEVQSGLSFFSSDERYARIRKIFVDKSISVQVKDLFKKDSMTNFWKTYQAKGYSPSLVYWSNVAGMAPTMQEYRNFQHNRALIPHGAIYVDSSRLEMAEKSLPLYPPIRMSVSPDLPRQLPSIIFFCDAIVKDNVAVLQELAAEKVPMEWYLPEVDVSPLMLAADRGSLKCLDFLLRERLVSAKAASSIHRVTALHLAATPEAAEMLLRAGADLNALDDLERTPLFIAAAKNRPQVVQYLLSRGAIPTAVDKEQSTPLIRAAESGSADCVRHLLDARNIDPCDVRPAFFAARGEVIPLMLVHPTAKKLGLTVNSQNKFGATLLHTAAYHGRVDDVNYLLACGANPELALKTGETPLVYAQRQGHGQVAEILQNEMSMVKSMVAATPASDSKSQVPPADRLTQEECDAFNARMIDKFDATMSAALTNYSQTVNRGMREGLAERARANQGYCGKAWGCFKQAFCCKAKRN